MKILLATSFFPPKRTAGTEQRTFGYAKTLLELGHQVNVLCVGNYEEYAHRYWNGFTDEIYDGIPVRRINLFWQKSPDPNGYLYKNPETEAFFRKCLVEWEPDIVHITSCLTLSASIIKASKDAGLPVVLTLTDFWFVCHKLSLWKYDDTLCDGITTSHDCIKCLCWNSDAYNFIKRFSSDAVASSILDGLSKLPVISRQRGLRGLVLNISERKVYLSGQLNAANVVTTPSSFMKKKLRNIGIAREIRVIQSGHDLSWLEKNVQKKHSHRVRLGFIGQVLPRKGVHVFLRAFGMYDWRGEAELHLYGDAMVKPEYWQELQNIEYSNPDAVYFHGVFPHQNLGKIFANLDVLVVPSLWHENNPRVIQEAFACGTPVIASNVGGIVEYVQHNVNGLLFQRGDSDDLRFQMNRVVKEPALLTRLRSHIPKVKSIGEEVKEFEMIYRELLSQEEVAV